MLREEARICSTRNLEGGGEKLVSFPNFMPSNVGATVFGGLVCGRFSLPWGMLRSGIDYLVIICFSISWVGLVDDGIWFSWWW